MTSYIYYRMVYPDILYFLYYQGVYFHEVYQRLGTIRELFTTASDN